MDANRKPRLPFRAAISLALLAALLVVGVVRAGTVNTGDWHQRQQTHVVTAPGQPEGTVSIETWNVGQQSLVVSHTVHVTASSCLSTSASIGGERDIYLEWLSGTNGEIKTTVDFGGTSDRFSYTSGDGMMGRVTLQWDGNDDDAVELDNDGLSNVDLTDGGTNDGIWLSVLFADLRADLRLEVYQDIPTLTWSYATVSLPVLSPGTRMDIFVPFTTFQDGGGGGANFTQTGAVVMQLLGNVKEGADVSIDFCEGNSVREYGDLPAWYGDSILDAGHIPQGMRLGYDADAEEDHHASPLADGDNEDNTDDEEGVTRRNRNGGAPSGDPNWSPGIAGNDGVVQVVGSGCSDTAPCYAAGWINWSGDGDFDDSGEQVLEQYLFADTAGTNFAFEIPGGTDFTDVRYYARFRICPAISDTVAHDWAPGYCASVTTTNVLNGEVEDYAWDWGHPTAVKLTSFTATGLAGRVVVAWETATEMDNLGFNLFRRQAGTADYAQLNGSLIPSQAPGQAQGASYAFIDTGVTAGQSYEYLLEDVDMDGTRTPHGPAAATVPYAIFLPLVSR